MASRRLLICTGGDRDVASSPNQEWSSRNANTGMSPGLSNAPRTVTAWSLIASISVASDPIPPRACGFRDVLLQHDPRGKAQQSFTYDLSERTVRPCSQIGQPTLNTRGAALVPRPDGRDHRVQSRRDRIRQRRQEQVAQTQLGSARLVVNDPARVGSNPGRKRHEGQYRAAVVPLIADRTPIFRATSRRWQKRQRLRLPG